jgi:hypothetical protein
MPNTLEREAHLLILGSTRSLSAAYLAQGPYNSERITAIWSLEEAGGLLIRRTSSS